MQVTVSDSLEQVAASDWNRLAGAANPFLSHEFLRALERNHCLGERTGWWPRHLLVREGGNLVGAAPAYLKDNSFGEFVFDWSWADAYSRAGLTYYPKLVMAVPFSPVTGPRMLVDPRSPAKDVMHALAGGAIACAERYDASSVHWLFPTERDANSLREHGFMLRTGCQFHWHNPGYAGFDDFLARLSAKKRKQIRHERRDVERAALTIEVLPGGEVTEAQWETYHHFYRSIFDRKWGMPSLTAGFFKEIGRTMAERVVLILASNGGRYVAGAFFLRGPDALFGRHWGCIEYHRALHFEVCYYRAIEYCIEHGLRRFEAGAQGEHKLARGFLPATTWSGHWIRHPDFRRAIDEFLARERAAVAEYVVEMNAHSPYKAGPQPPRPAPDPRHPRVEAAG